MSDGFLTPHPLDGAYLKLGRAWHHGREAHPFFETFRRTNPYPVVSYMDDDARKKVWVCDGDPDVPPLLLSLILGEAFYQFRSALDLLANELVIVNGHLPTNRTAFPICTDPSDWGKWFTRAKINGVHEDAVAIIEREQPCFGRHSYRVKWFAWLDDLWNVDKHRHLYLPLSGSGGGFFSHPVSMRAEWFIHEGPVKRGTVLATIDADHADVDFQPVKDVVFGEGVLAVGQSAEQLMFAMDSLVNGTLAMFRDFFPPRDASGDTRRPSTHPTGWEH